MERLSDGNKDFKITMPVLVDAAGESQTAGDHLGEKTSVSYM